MLEVSGLAAGYLGERVIDGVDVEVGTGEAVAIVGSKGAGKSTLFRAIVGLLPTMDGRVVLDERPGEGQLRLHVWPTLPADDDIHGHAWHYESVVVGGELRDIRFHETESDDGQPMWRHSYGLVGHRRFTLGNPCSVRLAQQQPADLRPGDRSGGSPGYIHRFFATVAPAATMLRVGPVVDRCSHVYRAEPVLRRAVVPRPTTRADVAEWVDYVAEISGVPAYA